MNDVTHLMTLAFAQAHDISEATLDLERLPELHERPAYASRAADSAVAALAHLASASGTWRVRPSEALSELAEGRHCLAELRHQLVRMVDRGWLSRDAVAGLLQQIDMELSAVLAVACRLRQTGRPQPVPAVHHHRHSCLLHDH